MLKMDHQVRHPTLHHRLPDGCAHHCNPTNLYQSVRIRCLREEEGLKWRLDWQATEAVSSRRMFASLDQTQDAFRYHQGPIVVHAALEHLDHYPQADYFPTLAPSSFVAALRSQSLETRPHHHLRQ